MSHIVLIAQTNQKMIEKEMKFHVFIFNAFGMEHDFIGFRSFEKKIIIKVLHGMTLSCLYG